ncbi:efflux RND transporter periplasmic adaptor subunit [Luedemannella helvata]|uniref:YknX-like C-terminal permuted SH3-like domain-containing protein n=1 Tax=Luedemannella helvata TaxID=349315 RepID=A0ABP4WSK3_9ACTN
MRRLPLAALLTTAALALTAASCDTSDDGVSTDNVRRATVSEVVDVPATVTARAAATLTAPSDGRLAKFSVAAGAKVRKGQVIAVIDSPAARKRLADARAALAAASSTGRVPQVGLTGMSDQVDAAADDSFAAARGAAAHITDQKVRAALLKQLTAAEKHYRATAAQARRVVGQVQAGLAGVGDALAALGSAQRAQAKAAYDLAKSTVDALTLRAPIGGVVQYGGAPAAAGGDSLADLLGSVSGGATAGVPTGDGVIPPAGVDDVLAKGDLVSAGTPIVTIVDVGKLGLTGEVDETDVLLVSAGVRADVELDAAPDASYEATVRSLDLLPTQSARGGVAYKVRLSLDGGELAGGGAAPTPRPGMSAVAHLRVRDAIDAVAVPAAAVFSGQGGDAVWVITGGKAVRQPVKVGVQGEDLVQIIDGLTPGQRVVVAGTDRVTEGQRIA